MTDFPEFIRRLPEIDIPLPGVSGHLLQGSDQQVAFVHFAEDVVVPEHSHRAQWELCLAGQVRLTVAGEERTVTAGEAIHIPQGVPHSGVVSAGYRAVIFFDQADRYRTRS